MMMTRNTLILLSCMLTLHVSEALTTKYQTDWYKTKLYFHQINSGVKKALKRRRLATSHNMSLESLGLRNGDEVAFYQRERRTKNDRRCRGRILLTNPEQDMLVKGVTEVRVLRTHYEERKITTALQYLEKAAEPHQPSRGAVDTTNKYNPEDHCEVVELRNIIYSVCRQNACVELYRRMEEQLQRDMLARIEQPKGRREEQLLANASFGKTDNKDKSGANMKKVVTVMGGGAVAGAMEVMSQIDQRIASNVSKREAGNEASQSAPDDVELASKVTHAGPPNDTSSTTTSGAGDFVDIDLDAPEASEDNTPKVEVDSNANHGRLQNDRRRLAGRRRLANMRRRRRTLMDRLHRGNVPVRN